MQAQKSKRQFKGTTKPKSHYDRKVVKMGYTITLSVGKLIPHDWSYVRIEKIEEAPTHVTLRIVKLIGDNNHAQTTSAHKTGEHNT